MLDYLKLQQLYNNKIKATRLYEEEYKIWVKRADEIYQLVEKSKGIDIYSYNRMVFTTIEITDTNIIINVKDVDYYQLAELSIPVELFISDDYQTVCVKYIMDFEHEKDKQRLQKQEEHERMEYERLKAKFEK